MSWARTLGVRARGATNMAKKWHSPYYYSTSASVGQQKSEGALTPETKSSKEVKHVGGDPGYDQITHTGQAWDKEDYRLARFEFSKKTVNPNIAMHLIAELPPIASGESVVRCDGGHPKLGHPRIYINLDKPGTHACGYCGQRFYNTHVTKGEDLKIEHIQV